MRRCRLLRCLLVDGILVLVARSFVPIRLMGTGDGDIVGGLSYNVYKPYTVETDLY